jgi:hypothetical protein
MNDQKTPMAAVGQDIRGLSAELLITVAGIITTVAVVGLNLLASNSLGFDLLSFSFWLVIPAGAIIGGMAAASGYYAAARVTQTMPSRALLFNMVAIAVSAWFLSKWASYATLRLDDGTRVADLVSFWQYFVILTESMQLSIGTRGNVNAATTGELGMLGYAREALQVFGFMAGGFVTYLHLSEVEACESCRRYAKTKAVLNGVAPEEFDRALAEAAIFLPNVAFQARIALGRKALAGLSLYLSRCPSCEREWLRPAIVTRSGDSLDVTRLGRYSVDGDGEEVARAIEAAMRVKT